MPELSFEQDVARRMPALQDLFAGVLERYCGGGDVGITQICDALGIHRKLAWQVRHVAYEPDPFAAVRHVPTPAGMEALLSALQRLGLPTHTSDTFRAAADSFADLVRTHAGDRTSMEMLVESASESSLQQAEVKWREKAFQGNSFIFGAQARTLLSTSILNFSRGKSDWFDAVQVRGLIGLKRVRRNVHWIVSQSAIIDDTVPDRRMLRTPLDPQGAEAMGGVPVMLDLCSQPLPELRRRSAEPGLLNDELLPAPVGFTGQQTIVTGEVLRELSPVHATPGHKRMLFGAVVRTPAEVFVYDQFVHRGLFPRVQREMCVFGELNSPITQDEQDRLPTSETIELLGRGITVARTPDVPGYQKILRAAFSAVGWDADQFDLYRIRMAYPPMPASVVIRHDLPPR